jgi:circadian clock protein KaiB
VTQATHESTIHRCEQAPAQLEDARYQLTLFVAGACDRSGRAIVNVRALCETYLPGRYELDVVDLFQHPELVAAGRVLAAPTMVKEQPQPRRVLVGDMSDPNRFLVGLDIRCTEEPIPGDPLNICGPTTGRPGMG